MKHSYANMIIPFRKATDDNQILKESIYFFHEYFEYSYTPSSQNIDTSFFFF